MVASYSSSFLKSNLVIFFGLMPKLGAQSRIPTSILVCIISFMVKNGCGQSGERILKLNLKNELMVWTACWCKFRKVKSWFDAFWVGVSLLDLKICCILKTSLWIEVIFDMPCWLWCNSFWLDWVLIYLNFKCQSTAVALVGYPVVARTMK